MTAKEGFNLETIVFDYIDQFKFLLFPDQWSTAFLDYSKNELLALLYIYRNKTANMTEIADYISAPLNTATGVVGRLEKKLMVERRRGNEDRRVVNIVLTKTAEDFINQEKESIEYYFKKVYKELSEEEKVSAMSILSKVLTVLKEGKDSKNGVDNTVKKIKRIVIE